MDTRSWFLFDKWPVAPNDRSILHIDTSDIIETFEGVPARTKPPFSVRNGNDLFQNHLIGEMESDDLIGECKFLNRMHPSSIKTREILGSPCPTPE